jgi:hypothetical protein
MSKLIDFYRGDAGTTESGHRWSDIVENWNDLSLESCHDWVQWVFPLPEPSNFSDDAPLLTVDEAKVFRADPELQEKVTQSFLRFLKFVGLKARWVDVVEPGHWFVNPGPNFRQQQYIWLFPNHNWYRITRVIGSLVCLGLEDTAASFYRCLMELKHDGPKVAAISNHTYEFWGNALQSEKYRNLTWDQPSADEQS